MSWTSEIWKQDDNLNLGYPFLIDNYNYMEINANSASTNWRFNDNFLNYPANKNYEILPINAAAAPSLWSIKKGIFLNYPYIKDILDMDKKTYDEIDLLLINDGINDLINRMINGQAGSESNFVSYNIKDSNNINYSNRTNELWNQLIHHMRNKFDCGGE